MEEAHPKVDALKEQISSDHKSIKGTHQRRSCDRARMQCSSPGSGSWWRFGLHGESQSLWNFHPHHDSTRCRFKAVSGKVSTVAYLLRLAFLRAGVPPSKFLRVSMA